MAPLRCNVLTMEGVQSFEMKPAQTAQELFDLVVEKIGLSSVPFYGLRYTDKDDYTTFLKLEKKLSHAVSKGDTIDFQFCVQFYPELIEEELNHPAIQRLFWLEIRKSIVEDSLYCPAEVCILFAGYSQQARLGDFSAAQHGAAGFLDAATELPQRVLHQHSLNAGEWEEKVKRVWKDLAGASKESVILDYLNVAQDLEMYGLTYFEITNKKGTKLWLGVHNLGMDIYEYTNKVTPRLGFPWTEIKKISFNDKKFTIKMVNKDGADFKFYSEKYKLNKRILWLCVKNHQFYLARRRLQAEGQMQMESRATIEAKIKRVKGLLVNIKRDLAGVLDQGKVSREDKIHNAQEAQGMDKFTTMKKVQGGDVSKRVAEFDALDDTEC